MIGGEFTLDEYDEHEDRRQSAARTVEGIFTEYGASTVIDDGIGLNNSINYILETYGFECLFESKKLETDAIAALREMGYIISVEV